VGQATRGSRSWGVGSSSRHLRLMYVRVRLHLVHAVVIAFRVAVALLSTVRGRALLGVHMHCLTVTTQRLGNLFGRRSLEPRGLSVHRGRVGRV